jgi:hypothetical protein
MDYESRGVDQEVVNIRVGEVGFFIKSDEDCKSYSSKIGITNQVCKFNKANID